MTGSLRALLESGVETAPGKVILSADGVDLTWSQLHEQACRVAAALVRDGIRPQDRVIYIGKNGLRFYEILFGCALAGAVMAPLNWRLAPDELAAIIKDAGSSIAIIDASIVGSIGCELRTVVALEQHERWVSYANWCGPPKDPGVESLPEHIAFQMYTSGTTGRPKGAMFANGTNLRVLLDNVSVEWTFTADDVCLVVMPLFHMGGLAWALTALARGTRCVVARDFEPVAILNTIESANVTIALFVPAMLAALSSVADVADRSLGLRRVFYAGAPGSPVALTKAMAALKCDFIQLYGLTEATGAFAQLPACDHDPSGPRAHLLLSAGQPYPWVQIRVVLPKVERDVPVGEIGEIWTRSDQNFVGYWNNLEQTARALTSDGWLRTGDLGRVDEDGRIFLVDRAKDLVVSGGENVYPVEVENVLSMHPQLAEVAVIGVPHERWGETVKAIVVPQPGAKVDAAEVIAFVRQRLAGFKCPTTVDVVEVLPRTATGKILKHVLREPYWRGYERLIN
jgi:acyl-CoA synthetase (AMP-forming)/AMP-acid ligase II